MKSLHMHVGDAGTIYIDANQVDAEPITLYDGPVETLLDDSLGDLDPGSRLYGQIWTAGPQVTVRYYEARPPRGEIVPICAVARLSGGQMRKRPESKPGTAILEFSRAGVYIVDGFR